MGANDALTLLEGRIPPGAVVLFDDVSPHLTLPYVIFPFYRRNVGLIQYPQGTLQLRSLACMHVQSNQHSISCSIK